jgi:hypothetical protein
MEMARELLQEGARASPEEIGTHGQVCRVMYAFDTTMICTLFIQTHWTPLMHAINLKEEKLDIVELLLDSGALINHGPLVCSKLHYIVHGIIIYYRIHGVLCLWPVTMATSILQSC